MVFYVHADGRKEFKGCVLLYYTWPDGDDWLPIEARTVEGWFVITGPCVLVCPD